MLHLAPPPPGRAPSLHRVSTHRRTLCETRESDTVGEVAMIRERSARGARTRQWSPALPSARRARGATKTSRTNQCDRQAFASLICEPNESLAISRPTTRRPRFIAPFVSFSRRLRTVRASKGFRQQRPPGRRRRAILCAHRGCRTARCLRRRDPLSTQVFACCRA